MLGPAACMWSASGLLTAAAIVKNIFRFPTWAINLPGIQDKKDVSDTAQMPYLYKVFTKTCMFMRSYWNYIENKKQQRKRIYFHISSYGLSWEKFPRIIKDGVIYEKVQTVRVWIWSSICILLYCPSKSIGMQGSTAERNNGYCSFCFFIKTN